MEAVKESLECLEYELLEPYPHLIQGTFTRFGGVSKGPFSTLNLGSQTSDSAESVKMNRELARRALGLAKIVYPQQTHGAKIQRITAKNQHMNHQVDAIYTTEKNIGLAVTHADCQAAIFYDPVHEAIGIAHCGWRGSVQNIYARLIETMQREIGTQPHNLVICISPSLGPCHAEFVNYKQELPKEFQEFMTDKNSNLFDFWKISKSQLMACGVLEKRIEIAEICTFCSASELNEKKKDYFSYRAEKDTGRNATFVALKP